MYIYRDLFDKEGYTKIILSLTNPFIDCHEKNLKIKFISWLNILGFTTNFKMDLRMETCKLCDMSLFQQLPWALSFFKILKSFQQFYYTNSIKEFWKRSHEAKSFANLAVAGLRGEFNHHNQFQVVDVLTHDDYDIGYMNIMYYWIDIQ